MSWWALLFCLAIGSRIAAININTPSDWTTSGPNTISWIVQPGDPNFFNIQLLRNGSANFDPIPNLLGANGTITTGVDSTSLYYIIPPSCMLPGNPSWPGGPGYSLQFYTESLNDTQTAIASTNTFDIANVPAPSCSSVSSSISPSASATAISSSSQNHKPRNVTLTIIGALIFCALLVTCIVLYKRHHQRLRKQDTQQFVMRKGLAGARPVHSEATMSQDPNV